MSRVNWGTVRKVLREAECALGGPNPSYASQKLEKARRYIFNLNRQISQQPRRFPPNDMDRLQKIVLCLKQANLRDREKRDNRSDYLLKGIVVIKALQESMGGINMEPAVHSI